LAAMPCEHSSFESGLLSLERVCLGLIEEGATVYRQYDSTTRIVIDPHEAIDNRIFPHRQPRARAVPRFHSLRISARTFRDPSEELEHD